MQIVYSRASLVCRQAGWYTAGGLLLWESGINSEGIRDVFRQLVRQSEDLDACTFDGLHFGMCQTVDKSALRHAILVP